jgi:glycosyltransferase involved in cell wall biosynthesis
VIDHVVAVSQHVRRTVCNGFPCSVIYNGVDPAHLTRSGRRGAMRTRLGFRPDDFVVGSMMRLTPGKNPELLVEAISRLPPRFKLLLVGWGSLEHKLLYMANRIAPGRCVITTAEEHLGDYYGALDAFCLPSTSEGFGLATLEAMFCGLPVITTKTGFPPELLVSRVHYVPCRLAAESIAKAVATVANNPRWAAGLAAEGRRAAERFGFASRMCRQYEDLFIRLWKRRARRRKP